MQVIRIAVWAAVLAAGVTGEAEAGINVWTSVGPFGGFTRALAIDPQNSDTVYVGSSAGVFKTTNGGASWNAVSSGLPRGYVPRSIAIDPQRPGIVYVGGACGTYGACGMFKSMDGGANWRPINSGLESTVIVVESLAIDAQNPDILYAGTTACFQTSGTPGWIEGADNLCYRPGVFKSTDGGTSWTGANNGLPWASVDFGFVMSLAVDPQTPTVVYAAAGGGAFKSTDGGASWTSLPLRANALAIDPQNPSALFAVGSGISQSTDGGMSWRTAQGLQSNCCGSLAIDPRNPNVVYVAVYYGGAFKSTDGGATWSDTGLPSMRDNSIAVDPSNPVVGLAIDPQNPDTLYAASNGMGVFKSTDGAGSWKPINQGLAATSVYASAIDQQSPDTIYAETSAGIVKTTDGGKNWTSSNSGLPASLGEPSLLPSPAVISIAIDPQTPSTLYAGIIGNLGNAQQPGGVFKSVDGGANWIPVNSPVEPGMFLASLTIDPRSDALYATGFYPNGVVAGSVSEIRKSADGGNNWEAAGAFPNYVRALVIDSQSTLYAVEGGGISRSTDGGASWTDLPVPTDSVGDCDECVPVGVLVVDPQRPDTLYAGGDVGVLKSTDGGASWQAMNSGLPWPPKTWTGIGAIVIDAHNSNTLYATMDGQVFRSTDGADTWAPVNSSGLTVTSVGALATDPKNPNTVYAVTAGGGIFAMTLVP